MDLIGWTKGCAHDVELLLARPDLDVRHAARSTGVGREQRPATATATATATTAGVGSYQDAVLGATQSCLPTLTLALDWFA
jgi:hypothetical protein